MADFIATTASNGPRLKDPEAAAKVLERFYWDSEVQATIQTDESNGHAYLAVYGYEWPEAWRIPDGVPRDRFEPDYTEADSYEGFEKFLKEIAQHLAEPLTVQAIGAEKCRYPLSACEWSIKPGAKKISINSFKHG